MEAEIIRELLCRLKGCQAKQLADKVDHIAGLMATKAIITFIHLHGWMLIRMKWAAGHTAGADLEPIKNGSLSSSDSCLHISLL